MNHILGAVTAAAALFASAHIAAAEPAEPEVSWSFGTIVEVPAAQVLSEKERHRLGLSAEDRVTATLAPRGTPDMPRS